MSSGTTVINKEYMEVVAMLQPVPTVYDLNYEVLTSVLYHTQVSDVNFEYIGNVDYHANVSGLFLEIIAAAPELSPQPTIPYFSLYFQT